jgi:hypothetical protein
MLVGMRTGYPPIKKTRAAISVYLAVCLLVYGFFGFGFHKMFQPLQFPNPGLAAYKPPPATVIIYFPTATLIYGEPAPSETATQEPSHDAPDEATRAYASATPLVTAALPVAHSIRPSAALLSAYHGRLLLGRPLHPPSLSLDRQHLA